MSIEYIGHKESQLEFVLAPIDRLTAGRSCRIADVFCGTGAVSIALKKRGHTVIANDALQMCAVFAQAALLNNQAPRFEGVFAKRARKVATFRYLEIVRLLERLPPVDGFITRTYSPRSKTVGGIERRYFTIENASKIDAIRTQIRKWDGQLLPKERALLLSDLVRAANSVANTAGTYGCYLKAWKRRALMPLQLTPARFTGGGKNHRVTCMDAGELVPGLDVDLVYADPPYTKRQYSAYYHVPETIVLDDAPKTEGSTGLRPWWGKRSAWCYRRQAPAALSQLVSGARCKWFLLSYNEDGQIPHSQILSILQMHGDVKFYERASRRYKSNKGSHRGKRVIERLYLLRKLR